MIQPLGSALKIDDVLACVALVEDEAASDLGLRALRS